MATQDVWTHNVAAIIITQVPLQSLDSALVLANAYLSDHGGWNTGGGQPVNGATEQQAADTITTEQYNAIYDLNVSCAVTLHIQMAEKLSAGLSISAALDAMENRINDFLTDHINNSDLPIQLVSVDAYQEIAARSTIRIDVAPDHTTTQTIRQSIAAALDGTSKLFDYKANGLLYARNTYGLDNTWNVDSVYTEPNGPIVMQIKKYTSTTYGLLDGGSTTVYVLTISPDTYGIVSGIILN